MDLLSSFINEVEAGGSGGLLQNSALSHCLGQALGLRKVGASHPTSMAQLESGSKDIGIILFCSSLHL